MHELLLAVVLATLISALCSVSEAVLYSVSWSYIEQMNKTGKKSGPLLLKLRNDIDQPITAILTLNTIAHTSGAAVAGAAAAKLFGSDSIVWFSAIFTVLILVFSEIIPKIVGVVYFHSLAPVIARPLQILVILFMPVIWISGLMVRFVQKKQGPVTSEDEVQANITLASRTGGIKPYEALSMRNILSLDDTIVRDIMTPRTVTFTLPAHLTVAEAKASKQNWPHSRIPVYGDDPEDIIGLVLRREVLEALACDQDEKPLADLIKPINFVLETMTLDKLLVRFLGSRSHLCAVLDEYGGFAGVVSLEDVLEEILGKEIVDETDQVVDMQELAKRKRKELMQSSGKKPEKQME